MAQGSKESNLMRAALGAGLIAAAVGAVLFVPRRRWVAMATPLRGVLDLPVAAAVAAWAVGMWEALNAPTPPQFDDLRPFDEF